jgi:hypothetical protein
MRFGRESSCHTLSENQLHAHFNGNECRSQEFNGSDKPLAPRRYLTPMADEIRPS